MCYNLPSDAWCVAPELYANTETCPLVASRDLKPGPRGYFANYRNKAPGGLPKSGVWVVHLKLKRLT